MGTHALLRKSLCLCCREVRGHRNYGKRLPGVDDFKEPFQIFKDDILDGDLQKRLPVPRYTDVCIIGGGIMGASAAFFLKSKMNKLNVTVIELDPSYSKASTVLSAGGMRQQFSLPENIQMSLFGAEFLRRINEHLSIKEEKPPDVQFNHAGYLTLAHKTQADTLMANYKQQVELGSAARLMSQAQLREKFKWLNTEGLECGVLGMHNEGWFDPSSLLAAFRAKAGSMGANFVQGKVIGFEYKTTGTSATARRMVSDALVELPDSGDIQPLRAAIFVNAAGASAGAVAKMAGIGGEVVPGNSQESILKVPLPVEPRKRFIYVWHCPKGPGLDCPLLTDITGAYFRREGLGGVYIGGRSPEEDQEPDTKDLSVDYDFFDNYVWPPLAARVPSFEELKLKNAWAGYYDYNYIDQNLIIGNHPYFNNFVFANGSSGHGLQHSIAIGRAIMELVLEGSYVTIDLRRFGFDRFLDDSKDALAETNIW